MQTHNAGETARHLPGTRKRQRHTKLLAAHIQVWRQRVLRARLSRACRMPRWLKATGHDEQGRRSASTSSTTRYLRPPLATRSNSSRRQRCRLLLSTPAAMAAADALRLEAWRRGLPPEGNSRKQRGLRLSRAGVQDAAPEEGAIFKTVLCFTYVTCVLLQHKAVCGAPVTVHRDP